MHNFVCVSMSILNRQLLFNNKYKKSDYNPLIPVMRGTQDFALFGDTARAPRNKVTTMISCRDHIPRNIRASIDCLYLICVIIG